MPEGSGACYAGGATECTMVDSWCLVPFGTVVARIEWQLSGLGGIWQDRAAVGRIGHQLAR